MKKGKVVKIVRYPKRVIPSVKPEEPDKEEPIPAPDIFLPKNIPVKIPEKVDAS